VAEIATAGRVAEIVTVDRVATVAPMAAGEREAAEASLVEKGRHPRRCVKTKSKLAAIKPFRRRRSWH